jgi:hypothetical protein
VVTVSTTLLDLLPARLTRRGPAWRDLDGWTLDPAHVDDPRTPERGSPDTWWTRLNPWWSNSGPWQDNGAPAHGIYHRPATGGLTDWAAAVDGWMIWRWSGPRMHWRSPLVSPWNPILAQSLTLDELGGRVPDLGDWERWTADAVAAGQKAAGYFGIRPRREMRDRVDAARAAGLAVNFRPRGCWAFAAQPGTLGHHFDLAALAAEYQRVLPAGLASQAATAIITAADFDVLTAAEQHEEHHEAVCGIALGYPPEVTAGLLLSAGHRADHRPEAAEYGAWCPTCRRCP